LEQGSDSGFSGSRGTNNSDAFVGFDTEGQIVEDGGFRSRGVCKGNIVETDGTTKRPFVGTMRFISIGDFEVEDPLEIAQSFERFVNALG
jgi:hypothetical protein